MRPGDTCRSDAARCFAYALHPLTPPLEAAYALLVSVPALETMAVEFDRHDVLTANGADLEMLAALYGADPFHAA